MAMVEVPFDPIKHNGIEKGSVVGDKGLTGFLVYAMPPVGAMDRDEEALKEAENQLKAQPGVRTGSNKTARKAREKALHRAAEVYFGV